MAAQNTALTEFSDSGNSRTYTLVGHTALSPQVVVQKRKVPSGNQKVAEDSINILIATEDASGLALPSKVSMSVTIRRPVDGLQADIDSALAILRDIVAGDEFGVTVTTQNYLI